MADFMRKNSLVSIVLLALLATPALAERRAIPNATFACEVQTESGIAGLIVIQADDIKTAKKAVIGESARTLNGRISTARSVVECVVPPKGKFRDSRFQDFYEKQPQ